MSTQPKPLRLADLIDPKKLGLEFVSAKNLAAAADQLRRQHDLNQELLSKLKLALHQNEHDMVMTAEECRQCAAAIVKAEGKAEGTPT